MKQWVFFGKKNFFNKRTCSCTQILIPSIFYNVLMQFSPIISEFLFTSVLCVIVLILKSQSQLSQPVSTQPRNERVPGFSSQTPEKSAECLCSEFSRRAFFLNSPSLTTSQSQRFIFLR